MQCISDWFESMYSHFSYNSSAMQFCIRKIFSHFFKSILIQYSLGHTACILQLYVAVIPPVYIGHKEIPS